MTSTVVSKFAGHAVKMHAAVLLPDTYSVASQRRYPVIYWIPGFGGSYHVSESKVRAWRHAMHVSGREFIVVFLDASIPSGHHEFADSANNGPWGTALTTEFIPKIERRFHVMTSPRGRLLAGHSSGGWSALWLQVTYPEFFGGAWSISPDPVDFRDFIGPDLTRRPPGNFFHDAKGREYGFVRVRGRDVTTLRKYVGEEDAKGTGNQIYSFDAVFSPRGTDGGPERLFDHRTGAIDPAVERYWEKHYDIARILRQSSPAFRAALRGKIHIFVGTNDTYHLDGPVHLLKDELGTQHSDAEMQFAPGYDHFDIFDYDGGLIAHIVTEMNESLNSSASAM
ncbi:MAG: alpha/beta hydrolase [Vulcanimicrobiaceae bacterium]